MGQNLENRMNEKITKALTTKWLGWNIHYYPQTDSTNVRAKALGSEGANGTLIVAGSQTDGRGRRGRSWQSLEEKNIYMSIYLKPKIAIEKAPMLTILMAYSAAKALRSAFGIEVQIKWPNDLILNKKKICGILTEMSVKQGRIEYVVIGIGINVSNKEFPEELKKSATSLFMETGRKFPRAQIIAEIMNVFEAEFETFVKEENLSWMQADYNQMLVNCGREVVILEPDGQYHARAQGINEKGELIVEREDGQTETVFAGEVSVRGIYGYV